MNYGKHIRDRRIALGLSQAQLGEAIGKTHKRISEFERETRIPDPEALDALRKFLSLPALSTQSVVLPANTQHLAKQREYVRPGQRRTDVRLRVARHRAPEWAHRINSCLSSEWKERLNLYASDSCWEALLVSHLVSTKPELATIRPLFEGYYQHTVLHPTDELPAGHLRFPAIIVKWKNQRIIFIPQVSLRTANGSEFTLDFLVGVKRKGGSKWTNLEVDGEGHEFSGDTYREQCLSMPTLRYTPSQIRATDFLETLLDAILAIE